MFLRSLQLANYRNFRRLALTLEDGPTVIEAQNAQGKTNLLEAIELLSTTKSSRAGTDRELIHWSVLGGKENGVSELEAFGRINAVVGQERGDTRAEVILRVIEGDNGAAPAVSKAFRINGLPRRALEFVGEINVVSFSPEDVSLVDGSPSGRRRYLDIMNSQMSSRYLRSLQRYGKVLAQRNSLLRHSRESGRLDPSLSVWDEELASNGAFLFQERARSVSELAVYADGWFKELGGWGQHLDIRYRPGLPDDEAAALRAAPGAIDERLGLIHAAFIHALATVSAKERIVGMSLVGPHRDDLSFIADGVDLNVFGSRGQQRLAALSLKLAQLDLLRKTNGTRPILLLDDVLSELDDVKQAAVLRVAASGGQTLLTVTSPDTARSALPDATVLHLEAGSIDMARRSV